MASGADAVYTSALPLLYSAQYNSLSTRGRRFMRDCLFPLTMGILLFSFGGCSSDGPECDSCPSSFMCGADNRCHSICNTFEDCLWCQSCVNGLCYPSSLCREGDAPAGDANGGGDHAVGGDDAIAGDSASFGDDDVNGDTSQQGDSAAGDDGGGDAVFAGDVTLGGDWDPSELAIESGVCVWGASRYEYADVDYTLNGALVPSSGTMSGAGYSLQLGSFR